MKPQNGLLQKSRAAMGRFRRNCMAAGWVRRGRRLGAAGRRDEAVAALRQAFDLDPTTPLEVYEALPPMQELQELHVREAERLQGVGLDREADRHFADAIASAGPYRESGDLDDLLRRTVADDHVVITQLAINYFPMFERWHRYFASCNVRNLLVIALDPVVYRKVRDMGVPVYLLPVFNFQAGIRSVLWHETVKFRHRLIERGVDYVHSDIDAFWLQNPLPVVRRQRADIVASIAYGTPREVVDEWGFVMCLGFYAMRSNPVTRRLYPAYVRYTRDHGHDQNGLNTLLRERGANWQRDAEDVLQGRCKALDLTMAVLPDALISRQESVYASPRKPLVMHPLLAVEGMTAKMKMLSEAGIE